MTRKVYLTEAEISRLEQMDAPAIGAFIMEKGTAGAAESFCALIRSYRIACSVANAAWKVMKELEGPEGVPSMESVQALERALHLYSPGNFPASPLDEAHTCQVLEETYSYLSQWAPDNMAAAMLEKLYERIVEYRGKLLGM